MRVGIVKKIKTVLMILAVLSLMTSCGKQENTGLPEEKEKDTNIEEYSEDEAGLVQNKEIVSYEVSDEEAVIYYKGEYFTKSVFCTGGDMIYLCGIKPEDDSYFIAGMKEEENRFSEFPVKIPGGMRVINMTADNQGRCHILLMSTEKVDIENEEFVRDRITYEESFIWIINKEGNTEKILDVSEFFFREQRRPFCFVTDYEGNYYFESGKELIKLTADGNLDMRLLCGGGIEAIGCGRSGEIFYIYLSEDGTDTMDMLKEGSAAGYEITLPHFGAQYSCIAAGTDTEALIYNAEGGVYTYDRDEGAVEQRIPESDMPVSGEKAFNQGFLGDGRMCQMVYEGENIVFYYLPAGK